MEILFLGTSSMVPTKERNHSAVFVSYKNDGILIDCGEGTQRQLRIAGIPLTKVTKILISHWHGDHTLGIPGLLQTLNSHSNTYPGTLEIYGPPGIEKQMKLMKEAFDFDVAFSIKLIEVKPGVVFNSPDFFMKAGMLEHSVPCYGYSIEEHEQRHINKAALRKLNIPDGPHLRKLQEGKDIVWKGSKVTSEETTDVTKGKKLAVIADTRLCKGCIELAEGADILICEATYANDLESKAEDYMHLTAGQAGLIANKANVGKLILTHFSQRYKNVQMIEEDASAVFDKVIAAKDFMRVKL